VISIWFAAEARLVKKAVRTRAVAGMAEIKPCAVELFLKHHILQIKLAF